MEKAHFADEFPGQLVSIGTLGVAFHPAPLPPEWVPSVAVQRLHEQALLRLGELRAIIPTLPNPNLLTSPFLRREAVLSSRIEGTHTEVEQLLLFEATENKPRRGESEQILDAREVLNYVRAMERGLKLLITEHEEESGLIACEVGEITQWIIRGMQQILMEGTRHKLRSPGQYRNCQAHIGTSRDISLARYVPPPPEWIQEGMDNLEHAINAHDKYPSLVNIALVHYQFEAIHPFEDGNGRTGRLLIMLMLMRYGLLHQPLLYLSAYFERHREEYNERMWQVSRCGDWEGWVKFFLEGVETEAADAMVRARRLLNLREVWRRRLQEIGGSAKLLQLIDHLFASPVISVNEAKQRLDMSYRGAQKNIDKLEELGFLVESTGQQRNRLYVAKPISRLLAEKPADQIEYE